MDNISRTCQLEEALSPHTPENCCICQELDLHRQNLLLLLCRILRDAPEYMLRPSELAVGSVGDLSFLSQENRAYLYMRMEPEIPSQIATSDILRAKPCSSCPLIAQGAKK